MVSTVHAKDGWWAQVSHISVCRSNICKQLCGKSHLIRLKTSHTLGPQHPRLPTCTRCIHGTLLYPRRNRERTGSANLHNNIREKIICVSRRCVHPRPPGISQQFTFVAGVPLCYFDARLESTCQIKAQPRDVLALWK